SAPHAPAPTITTSADASLMAEENTHRRIRRERREIIRKQDIVRRGRRLLVPTLCVGNALLQTLCVALHIPSNFAISFNFVVRRRASGVARSLRKAWERGCRLRVTRSVAPIAIST